jgi:hypothetical protein
VPSLRILLPRKTDNLDVGRNDHSNHSPTRPPDNEPYACFLQRKDEIAAWLRSGYSVRGVWLACEHGEPPFEASYQTFWRYCRQHGLSVPRGSRPKSPPRATSEAAGAPKQSEPLRSSPKVWPRVEGKPREFIPRTED